MASATATWTPNSLQLRLAFTSSGVRRISHSVYLRPSRFGRKSRYGVVYASQKPEVDAWTGSDSSKPSSDGLAGWDDSGSDDKSSRAAKKSWIEGICVWEMFDFSSVLLSESPRFLKNKSTQLVKCLVTHWKCLFNEIKLRLQGHGCVL